MAGDLASFVRSILSYAQQTSAQTGLPLDYVIAQSAQETGYGTSNAALNYNNYFGISPGGSLASYPSIGEGFSAYANLVNSRYPGASGFSDPSQIAEYMVSQGYNTADPNYAGSVASIVPSVDKVLSALGVAVGGGGTAPTQNAAQGSGGFAGTIAGAVSKIGIVLLAIVVTGVGLWMLSKGGAIAPT